MVDTALLAMVANPLDGLSDEMDELLDSFMSKPLVGSSEMGLTTYIFWMCVALALLLIVIFAFKARQTKGLVPEGVFVNAMESVVEFVRDDMCKSILGDSWKRQACTACEAKMKSSRSVGTVPKRRFTWLIIRLLRSGV